MEIEEKFITDRLMQDSAKAVECGHGFPGYFGFPASAFNKEELIMLLNVVYDMYFRVTQPTDGFASI